MDEVLEAIELYGGLAFLGWLLWKAMNASTNNSPAVLDQTNAAGPDVGTDVAGSPAVPDFSAPATNGSAGPAPVSSLDKIKAWANAIFNFEGGGNPLARNARNNNPGNLKGTGFAGQVGTDSGGFAIFDSIDQGFQALYSDLQTKVQKYPDYSILQIMTRYLGGNPLDPQVTDQGNPFAYADYVASQLGTTSDATLRQTFGG